MKVGDLRRNSGECQGGSHEYGVLGSPKFARLRQSSHEGALMLPIHPGICLIIRRTIFYVCNVFDIGTVSGERERERAH